MRSAIPLVMLVFTWSFMAVFGPLSAAAQDDASGNETESAGELGPGSDDPDSGDVDEQARGYFYAGMSAFQSARYDEALRHFERAHELSGRPELLYNIGITADRLRQDERAVEAFEAFLAQVDVHPRRSEVEARLEAIREALAEGEQATATVAAPIDAMNEEAEGGVSGWAVGGAVALGALGIAGVGAAIAGLAASGCSDTTEGGLCVEERTKNGAAVGLYGGLGLAAIAGAIVLLIIGLGDDEDRDAPVAMEGMGVRCRF